jgi:hypothetical protein
MGSCFGGLAALVLVASVTAPAAGAQTPIRAATPEPTDVKTTFAELSFAHPVSLPSATTITTGAGLDVLGYHFVTDSIVGDFWPDGGMTVDDFLAQVEKNTGTAPEITSAYVDAQQLADSSTAKRSAPVALGADLPAYDAPDADASLALQDAKYPPPADQTAARTSDYTYTWVPNSVESMVQSAGTTLAISAKYSWYGLTPFATPTAMADHWGMEFQYDFYTHARDQIPGSGIPIGYGWRPSCGNTLVNYKDWAAASTRPFNWFAWVIYGGSQIAAPGNLGLYGDFNDLSDPCEVSSITVGMAQPQVMGWANSTGGNYLSIYMYPLKGDDTSSELGAIVQPVSRSFCETWPQMPLMDCMGVTPGSYPGPGQSDSRMVLNRDKWHYKAPNLCWYSGNFGDDPAQFWDCRVIE